MVWWGAETVLLSYVPDPFLPRDDVIAKWRQEWVGLRQTMLRPDDGTFFAKHKDLCAHRVSMVLFICRSSNDISRVTERDCLEFSGSVG